MNNVDSKYQFYSYLPDWKAQGGGTIPPALCVTNLKPDIVILDEHKKIMHTYELTVPLNMNIDTRNKEKTQKYTPFMTYITGFQCNINCFEVSSTGFILARNKSTLLDLHKLLRKGLKKTTFFDNLNFLAWCGSCKVWMTRENPEFAAPPFLIPHLGDIPTPYSAPQSGRSQGQ